MDDPRENVNAVTRALQVLDAFGAHEQGMSLAELSRRLGMGKPTLLRTARTLARSGYLVQMDDRRWRLGPAAGSLGVRYQTSFDTNNAIDLVLRRLAGSTRESAALFVVDGNSRTCVARVDRPSLTRHHIRAGEMLPLDRGASGRILTAYLGEPGAYFDSIRRRGFYVSLGERDRTMASIAVPVIGARRRLFGAVCVSGTVDRLGQEALLRHLPKLQAAAAQISRAVSAPATRREVVVDQRWRLPL
ncbi:MAG: IclR family transcriptional regulator [Casimicrobiaceae bacterium]